MEKKNLNITKLGVLKHSLGTPPTGIEILVATSNMSLQPSHYHRRSHFALTNITASDFYLNSKKDISSKAVFLFALNDISF